MLTITEKEARYKALRKILETDNLQALLLIGDTNVGPDFCGDFRYYTNNRIIFYRQVLLVLPEFEPVLFAGSEIQRQAATRRSFVKDCRFSDNLVVDVTKFLKEKGISSGRVGVNQEMLTVAWLNYFRRELPEIEWVETHDRIMEIRTRRSREEADICRKGASLGDGGFEAALKAIRPGANEYEIVAEIEHYARARGADEHFTLIGSGKFTFGENNTLPLPYSPSPRHIEVGDSVVMEISPRFAGYWTQLVRTVNVGKRNTDLEKIHKVCRDAIVKGLEQFKPGKRVKDLVLAMESCVNASGYLLKPPLGHICGVDLIEGRVSRQNQMVLTPGTSVIIHPTIHTPDGKNSFFWGETYSVTPDGFERLHRAGDDLITV